MATATPAHGSKIAGAIHDMVGAIRKDGTSKYDWRD